MDNNLQESIVEKLLKGDAKAAAQIFCSTSSNGNLLELIEDVLEELEVLKLEKSKLEAAVSSLLKIYELNQNLDPRQLRESLVHNLENFKSESVNDQSENLDNTDLISNYKELVNSFTLEKINEEIIRIKADQAELIRANKPLDETKTVQLKILNQRKELLAEEQKKIIENSEDGTGAKNWFNLASEDEIRSQVNFFVAEGTAILRGIKHSLESEVDKGQIVLSKQETIRNKQEQDFISDFFLDSGSIDYYDDFVKDVAEIVMRGRLIELKVLENKGKVQNSIVVKIGGGAIIITSEMILEGENQKLIHNIYLDKIPQGVKYSIAFPKRYSGGKIMKGAYSILEFDGMICTGYITSSKGLDVIDEKLKSVIFSGLKSQKRRFTEISEKIPDELRTLNQEVNIEQIINDINQNIISPYSTINKKYDLNSDQEQRISDIKGSLDEENSDINEDEINNPELNELNKKLKDLILMHTQAKAFDQKTTAERVAKEIEEVKNKKQEIINQYKIENNIPIIEPEAEPAEPVELEPQEQQELTQEQEIQDPQLEVQTSEIPQEEPQHQEEYEEAPAEQTIEVVEANEPTLQDAQQTNVPEQEPANEEQTDVELLPEQVDDNILLDSQAEVNNADELRKYISDNIPEFLKLEDVDNLIFIYTNFDEDELLAKKEAKDLLAKYFHKQIYSDLKATQKKISTLDGDLGAILSEIYLVYIDAYKHYAEVIGEYYEKGKDIIEQSIAKQKELNREKESLKDELEEISAKELNKSIIRRKIEIQQSLKKIQDDFQEQKELEKIGQIFIEQNLEKIENLTARPEHVIFRIKNFNNSFHPNSIEQNKNEQTDLKPIKKQEVQKLLRGIIEKITSQGQASNLVDLGYQLEAEKILQEQAETYKEIRNIEKLINENFIQLSKVNGSIYATAQKMVTIESEIEEAKITMQVTIAPFVEQIKISESKLAKITSSGKKNDDQVNSIKILKDKINHAKSYEQEAAKKANSRIKSLKAKLEKSKEEIESLIYEYAQLEQDMLEKYKIISQHWNLAAFKFRHKLVGLVNKLVDSRSIINHSYAESAVAELESKSTDELLLIDQEQTPEEKIYQNIFRTLVNRPTIISIEAACNSIKPSLFKLVYNSISLDQVETIIKQASSDVIDKSNNIAESNEDLVDEVLENFDEILFQNAIEPDNIFAPDHDEIKVKLQEILKPKLDSYSEEQLDLLVSAIKNEYRLQYEVLQAITSSLKVGVDKNMITKILSKDYPEHVEKLNKIATGVIKILKL